jgi:hypothetical protein
VAQFGEFAFDVGFSASDLSCEFVAEASVRVMRLRRMTLTGTSICWLLSDIFLDCLIQV